MRILSLTARGWRREPNGEDDSGEEFLPIMEQVDCPTCDGTGKVQRECPGALAAARRHLRLTQVKLAELAGVTRSKLAALELGRGKLPFSLIQTLLRADRDRREAR